MKRLFFTLLILFSIVTSVIVTTNKSSTPSAAPITTIEVFSIENVDQHSNIIGYRHVNAITEIIDDPRMLQSKTSTIEDHFDSSGKYIKTIVKEQIVKDDLSTKKAYVKTKEQILQTPQTIYTNDLPTATTLPKENLTNVQLDEISSFVKKLTATLPETKFVEIPSISAQTK